MEIINTLYFVFHTKPFSEQKFKDNYEGTSGGTKFSDILSSFNHALRAQGIYHTKTLGDGNSTAQKVGCRDALGTKHTFNKTRMHRSCTEKNGSETEGICERKSRYKFA